MDVVSRFLKYVSIDTESSPDSMTSPSTAKQFDLANLLKEEMHELGLQDIYLDEFGVLYGTILATDQEHLPTIGFIAHMDTSPDMSGKDVKPRIIHDYDGTPIILNEALNIVMDPKEFPSLKTNIHHDLIVTDGTTLLGGDDKAGIAEIMSMAQYLLEHPEIAHGTIKVAFTPDEEVGRGTEHFDIERFGCDFAYTVDGGEIDCIDYENFNAASCRVTVQGKGIHPGSAKYKMVNSLLVAMEFQHLLPVFDNPAYTEGYEGFNHLNNMNGNVDISTMDYIIRNHDEQLLEKQKQDFVNAAEFLNKKYGYEVIHLEIKDTYSNMRKHIEKDMRVIDKAKAAMIKLNIVPRSTAIRGGTDGASLTYQGLPCPNLGTGGYNAHGKYEYVSIHAMKKCVELLIEIAKKN